MKFCGKMSLWVQRPYISKSMFQKTHVGILAILAEIMTSFLQGKEIFITSSHRLSLEVQFSSLFNFNRIHYIKFGFFFFFFFIFQLGWIWLSLSTEQASPKFCLYYSPICPWFCMTGNLYSGEIMLVTRVFPVDTTHYVFHYDLFNPYRSLLSNWSFCYNQWRLWGSFREQFILS